MNIQSPPEGTRDDGRVALDTSLTFTPTYTVNPRIHGFHICKLAYSLKSIGNPKTSTCGAFVVICRRSQSGESLSRPSACSQLGLNKVTLPSRFSSHTINKCPFHCLLSATFLHFSAFSWWLGCLKRPPSIALKGRLVFLSARMLWYALQRKYTCATWASFRHKLWCCWLWV